MIVKHLIALCVAFSVSLSVHGNEIHIVDDNLRASIKERLDIPPSEPITQQDILRLVHLSAYNRGIADLSGLQAAHNLGYLALGQNPIIDLSPVAGLTNLRGLVLPDCDITDIRPLANLIHLEELNLRRNPISDITPLAPLATLKYLDLGHCEIIDISILSQLNRLHSLQLNDNRIGDVRPLSQLTSLRKLEIQDNLILDHSPLDMLSLDVYQHDQWCDIPPMPLAPRLYNRNYPSIIARWSGYSWPPVKNRPELSAAENIALHDLWFNDDELGLRPHRIQGVYVLSGDVDDAIRRRDELRDLNPNMIILMSLTIRTAKDTEFPPDSPYWIRKEDGTIFREYWNGVIKKHRLMDFTHPDIQDRIVDQAIAVSKCGLYDGIFFDHWSEEWPILTGTDINGTPYVFRSLEIERQARLNIVRRIRASTRPDFLIMGNTNDRMIPRTGPYINGGFMEMGTPEGDGMRRLPKVLTWHEQNLLIPRINAIEGWTVLNQPADSPTNLRWMRAFTTLALTHSDGYAGFVSSTDHTSHWYDFWDADLGRPVGEQGQLYQEIDGLYIREFTNGWAVYNHSGDSRGITLPEETKGVASQLEGFSHTLANRDGEMYLRVTPVNPADVNGDGVVNIFDLTLVAQAIGTGDGDGDGDVNGDGVVNVFDLVQVAGAIGGGGAAPSAYSPDSSIISAADVKRWLTQAQSLGVGDANLQRGIRFLEGLLAALTPTETALLPNYPNPFNPETWIPYRLAREAEVAITVYDTKGRQVRRLALGNQAAGHYAERGKAAYWDGRNERGEAVASGIYIYQFRAGDYAAARRLVIVK